MKGTINKLFGTTYKKKRKRKIIFVLSAGRCGSTSIAQMFNGCPDFLAYHEEIPELIYLSTHLAENPSSKYKIYSELERIFQEKEWEAKRKQIIVHSDHRLWNLVEFISEYFPNSYFIHLMRNPYDSIKSIIPRKWYTEYDYQSSDKNLHAKYRLQANRIGVISNQQWLGMNQLEKCVWYWNHVNITIHQQLQKLGEHRHISIQLEEMELQLNEKVRELLKLKKDFQFKEFISNESEKPIEIENDFNLKFLDALEKYGSEFTQIFYPVLFKSKGKIKSQ